MGIFIVLTYSQQPLFEGGGETPNYEKSTLDYLICQLHKCQSVFQSYGWGVGGGVMGHPVYNKDHIFSIRVKYHTLYIIDLFGFAF